MLCIQFEQQAKEKVSAIAWVKQVDVKMTAQPAKPLIADDVPAGLRKVSNIVAVSSCKVCSFPVVYNNQSVQGF